MIRLGYEIGSGKPVEIPLRHLAVTGQTQESGKTTTLEALITRSGLRAVAFVTKRGEKSFRLMTPIPAYFREPAITAETPMWKWVGSILEAAIDEKMGKEERAAIIQASDRILESRERVDKSGDTKTSFVTTRKPVTTLGDVHANIRVMMDSSRGGFKRACICLDAYFRIVIPQIARLKSSKDLELQPGVNVMDLEDQTDEMQSLIIRSVIETVYREKKNIVVIVPEAAKFIPNRRNSPVRFAAEMFIRQGLGIGNVLMLDSQDLANVATEVLKSVGVWILGKQTEINEVRRVVEYIPAAPKIPASEIQQLGKGEFYAVFSDQVKKVYVQPAGMTDEHAEAIATGQETADSWKQIVRKLDADSQKTKRSSTAQQIQHAMDLAGEVAGGAVGGEIWPSAEQKEKPSILSGESSDRRERDPARIEDAAESRGTSADPEFVSVPRKEWDRLNTEVERLRRLSVAPELSEENPQARSGPVAGMGNGHFAGFLKWLRATPEAIAIVAEKPTLRVKVDRPVVDVSAKTCGGRCARLIADGYFTEAKTASAAHTEMTRRGWGHDRRGVYRELDNLTEMGFLTKETDGYLAVAEMRVLIEEQK